MCMRFWTTFLDHHVPKTSFSTIDSNDLWTPSRAHFVPHRGQKINSPFRPGSIRSASDWSQNTNMKWLKNVELPSKSRFSPQKLPNLSEDTNIQLQTWNCRPNQLLDFENIQNPIKIMTSKLPLATVFIEALCRQALTAVVVCCNTLASAQRCIFCKGKLHFL